MEEVQVWRSKTCLSASSEDRFAEVVEHLAAVCRNVPGSICFCFCQVSCQLDGSSTFHTAFVVSEKQPSYTSTSYVLVSGPWVKTQGPWVKTEKEQNRLQDLVRSTWAPGQQSSFWTHDLAAQKGSALCDRAATKRTHSLTGHRTLAPRRAGAQRFVPSSFLSYYYSK